MHFTKRHSRLFVLYLNFALLLSVLGSFTYSTIAWFNTNRKVSVTMQSIKVAVPDFIVEEYKIYGVTTITKTSTNTTLTFVNEEISSLPIYDPQSIEPTRFQKAAVVYVRFSNAQEHPITFVGTTINALFSTGTLGVGTYDENYTSNVFQIIASTGAILTNGWTSATLTFANAEAKSFVTVASPPIKTTTIDIKTIHPGDHELWFVIEYNEAILNYIGDARMANPRPVHYIDDIVYEVV